MPENLLTVHQVAQILSISRSYVYFLARVGELPHVRIHKAIRVRPRELEAFIKHRRLRFLRNNSISLRSPGERSPQHS